MPVKTPLSESLYLNEGDMFQINNNCTKRILKQRQRHKNEVSLIVSFVSFLSTLERGLHNLKFISTQVHLKLFVFMMSFFQQSNLSHGS